MEHPLKLQQLSSNFGRLTGNRKHDYTNWAATIRNSATQVHLCLSMWYVHVCESRIVPPLQICMFPHPSPSIWSSNSWSICPSAFSFLFSLICPSIYLNLNTSKSISLSLYQIDLSLYFSSPLMIFSCVVCTSHSFQARYRISFGDGLHQHRDNWQLEWASGAASK